MPYGFHNLDCRTAVLADGSVHSYLSNVLHVMVYYYKNEENFLFDEYVPLGSLHDLLHGLSLEPLIGAISAGNTVVIKPSELAPASSEFLANTVPEKLLEHKWHKIFFTGSARVGRTVMAAAAKNLTPVALELGGKCPAIVDSLSSI